ncbi:MAG: hypothetical protein ACXVHW_03695 [Methanobacterium sp.]
MFLDLGKNESYSNSLPFDSFSKIVKLNEKFKIKLDISLSCSDYWMKIFDQSLLKLTNLKRVNGPETGTFLDKGIIEFKPIKKGELNLSFVEMNHLGPYKELIYNIKIID